MDTKSRKFSRTCGVKALLLIMYIACFAAVGVITGFVPANGYMNYSINGFDAMFADNVENTTLFQSAVTSKEAAFMNREMASEDDIINFVSDADFYVRIVTDSQAVYNSDIVPYWQYDCSSDGNGGFLGKGFHVIMPPENLKIKSLSIGMEDRKSVV